ncbi:DUF4241 domain-containing protein [Dysgonomonas sp. 521]|uniref:DUF4241 domain-containing protein n=1 Tax=Dysgonomonas sp. 521 TaxID=2302932 RepID=UPI0013D88D5A|nr:DUF4241 domain-containing protein [Dysgonomonas sp. 521]NDV97464.1 DUF4241 domain-containing protein [Dysgonomonas sp. 521]
METLFNENKAVVESYPFVIPERYSEKVPKNIPKKYHEGCEIIRRGRIKEGLDVLISEGEKYQPLTAYVLAQLNAYFSKDWMRVMDLLIYAMSNEVYYSLIKAYWRDEKLFDYMLVDMAAIKTNRIDEAQRLLTILEKENDNPFKKDHILQPEEYLSLKETEEPDRLNKEFEEAKVKDYYRQDYRDMAYGFIKLGETDKVAESLTGWNEWRKNYIDSKSIIVVPVESLFFHEFYHIGDNSFMAKQWQIQQEARYVRLPEDGPADTRLPKSKPCNNLKGLKISGLFEAAFDDKLCVYEGWIFEKRELGNIDITSGEIITADPLVSSGQPFITAFPKGAYPVEIALASKFGDRRVALARLKFSNNDVQSWDIALTEDIKPKKDELYGYGVDSGTGCFADADSYKEYLKQLDEEDGSDYIIKEFEKNGNTGLIYKDVAMFSTGLGDGFYQSYIGRDTDSNIVCLITDFQIFNQ